MLSLFTKELRQQASLALVVFALGLIAVAYAFAQAVLAADGRWPVWLGERPGAIPLYLWLIAAALLLTAPAYAAERQQGTEIVLHTLPETRYVLWVTKGGAALLLLALAGGLPMLLTAALLVHYNAVAWLGGTAAGALMAACLGLFASALARSTYTAVLYSLLGLGIYFGLVVSMAWLPGVDPAGGASVLLGLVLMVMPACLVGSYRVMTTPPTESWRPGLATAALWLGLTALGAVALWSLIRL